METTRICDEAGCGLVATHTLVWVRQMFYCVNHAQRALDIADQMGLPTPGNTVRRMVECENVPQADTQ